MKNEMCGIENQAEFENYCWIVFVCTSDMHGPMLYLVLIERVLFRDLENHNYGGDYRHLRWKKGPRQYDPLSCFSAKSTSNRCSETFSMEKFLRIRGRFFIFFYFFDFILKYIIIKEENRWGIPPKMPRKIFCRVSKLRTHFSPFLTEKPPPEKMKMSNFHLISSSVFPPTFYMVE